MFIWGITVSFYLEVSHLWGIYSCYNCGTIYLSVSNTLPHDSSSWFSSSGWSYGSCTFKSSRPRSTSFFLSVVVLVPCLVYLTFSKPFRSFPVPLHPQVTSQSSQEDKSTRNTVWNLIDYKHLPRISVDFGPEISNTSSSYERKVLCKGDSS